MTSNKKNPGILEDFGLKDLPEERRQELLDKMSSLIQNRVLLRVLRSLSLEEKKGLDSIIATNDMEQVNKFLIEKVPNIDDLTDQEVEKFKTEVKNQLAGLKI